MPPRATTFGFPLGGQPRSAFTYQTLDPTQGLRLDVTPSNLEPGQASVASNVVLRYGAIQCRPGFERDSPSGAPVSSATSWRQTGFRGAMFHDPNTGYDYRFLFEGPSAAFYGGFATGTSVASYISSLGTSLEYSVSTGAFARGQDPVVFRNVYDLTADDWSLVWAVDRAELPPFQWFSSNTTYTHLTDDIRAHFITPFDNRLMAWNSRYSGDPQMYPTRVIWSDRGDVRAWSPSATTVTAGYEDLLDMAGRGTWIEGFDQRVILFSDREIWQGYVGTPPFTFLFSPLNRQIGCVYGQTVKQTPSGLAFVGSDGRAYLLGQDNSLRHISAAVDRRGLGTRAVYDPMTREYRVFDAANAQSYRAFNIDSGVWTEGHVSTTTVSDGVDFNGMHDVWSGDRDTYGVADLPNPNIGTPSMFYTSGLTAYAADPSATFGKNGDSGSSVIAGPSAVPVNPCTMDWRGPVFTGTVNRSVTVRSVGLDYRSEQTSHVTVGVSYDGGATFPSESRITLVPTTGNAESRQTAWLYGSGGKPLVRVQSSQTSQAITRLHVEGQIGGR